jgi:hypothetical protein
MGNLVEEFLERAKKINIKIGREEQVEAFEMPISNLAIIGKRELREHGFSEKVIITKKPNRSD